MSTRLLMSPPSMRCITPAPVISKDSTNRVLAPRLCPADMGPAPLGVQMSHQRLTSQCQRARL